MVKSGLLFFNLLVFVLVDKNSKVWVIWFVWEEIYVVEGSDWFWWYGLDMIMLANDDIFFDKGFRAYLLVMY